MPFQKGPFDLDSLATVPGVYGIAKGRRVIYVGQTDNLSHQIHQHRDDRLHCIWGFDLDGVDVEVVHDDAY